MWIVRLALRRPYTFVVASILILILGVVSIVRTPVDIFPNIDIPVVTVVWQYTGLSPEEMSNRIVFNYERSLTTTVNDIEHIESQSLAGIAIVKIYSSSRNAQIAIAVAQVTAISQSTVKQLPPGTTPPFIIDVQRLDGADSAARSFGPRLERAAIGGYGPEFHPHRL